MSKDGGLEDVAEFFRAAASCSWSFATVASAQRAAPPIADNSDKTSVPWLSWLAMLNHRP